MAETLTELVAKIETDAAGLEKGLTDAERKTEASSKKMQESLKKVGIVMAASGAAITAALGLMGKAAIDEDINIKRLATTINNSGTAYDSVKDSMEALITTTQRKTGIADNEQRDILNRLILVTNDYGKAMGLLPIVLDLAAAGEMDATTAATYLGKAYLELEDGAEEVSVRFGQASLQFKNMEDVQNRVAGSAENLANPLSVLKATAGDISEEIGKFLIPTIKDLVDKFNVVSVGIQNWIKLNPELVEGLVFTTAKLGGLLLVIGSIILIAPKVIGFITMITGLMGPWGWAVLAVTAAVGYLVAELLGLSDVMAGIKDIMADVEKQMFIMRAEQALSKEEWARIKEQGYLTEQQFINLAKAMKLTTEELYNQMEASGMLQQTMTLVGDTNVYLTQKTEEAIIATTEQTDATKENIAALKAQQDELLSTTDKLRNMRREYEYTRSDAGRLGISLRDVTFALFDMGKSTEEITEILSGLGEESDDVNAVMKAFNLTAQEVIDILNQQKDSIDGVTESLKDQANAVADLATAQARAAKAAGYSGSGIGFGGGEIESGMSPYQVAYQKGYDFDNLTPSQYQEIADITGINEFQSGGIVPGTIGQPQLAMVHGGETIIPANESMGNVNIYLPNQPIILQREDQLYQLGDIISRALDRKYRLGGRSLA